MTPTVHDELYRKAVERLSSLQSAFEHDRISAESFKVGVETIWAVLGGVVDTDDFVELMWAANQEVLKLKIEPRIRILSHADDMLLVARAGELVRIGKGRMPASKIVSHDTEDEAVSYVHHFEQTALARGYGREL